MQEGQKFSRPRAYGVSLGQKRITLWLLLKPYGLSLILGCVLLLFTNLIIVSLPMLINFGVRLIENKNKIINFSSYSLDIFNIIFLLVGLALFGGVLRTFSRLVIFDVGRKIERDVRARLFNHVAILDDKFFVSNSVGEIMTHLTTDINNIRMITGFAVLNIMNIIFIFCLTVPYLWRIDIYLAFAALVPFPLVIIATSFLTGQMFITTKKYQENFGKLVSHVQENLLGAHVIRLFHQQEYEEKRFKNTNNKTYQAAINLARVRVLMFPILRLVLGVTIGLIILVGGHAIIEGRIVLGDFVETNARILQLAWPAMSVGFVMSVYSRGQASLARINKILGYCPNIIDGCEEISHINQIDVADLILTPEKNNSGISFSVKSGNMLGIVGSSGSYKTTLLRALYRRIKLDDGTVFFNQCDINNLKLKSIYNNISVVAQEPFLFHKSILDNIRFSRPQATVKEVQDILPIVCLEKDISFFDQGLETVIGERGVTLSGGQKQRVALATALLSKKSVLILDDALSAVDAKTENKIISHMQKYIKNKIIILVTHRLQVLEHAQNILVLDSGQICEQGRHSKLIKQNGYYAQLWRYITRA